MRSGDLVCTTRCEVDDDDCEIWFGGSDDGTKKEENLLNFSVFSIFNSLHLFNLTSLLPHSTPHASLPQTKRKAPQLLLFAVVFPKWREKKMRDVFLPSPILPLAYVRDSLFSSISHSHQFSSPKKRSNGEMRKWWERRKERKNKEKKYEKKMKIVLEDFSLLFCISNWFCLLLLLVGNSFPGFFRKASDDKVEN